MDIVTIDAETYYDKEYSLSKMTTEAYVRDPRFEVIGVGIKINDYPVDWYSGSDPGRFLRQLDYSKMAILCHNTVFDGAILSWHFGIRPKLWLDTLSMARPLHNISVGGSLKALAAHYKLGEKGDEVVNAIAKRRADFAPSELERYAAYCCNDVDLTYKLFRKMARNFPAVEIALIDQTIRMFTEPSIVLDTEVLTKHLQEVKAKKASLVDELGLSHDYTEEQAKSMLMSNQLFATYLTALGVTPPTKVSAATGKETFAFSKTDKRFTDLLEHDDARVVSAVAARLGVKSTLEETRTESLRGVAERGALPIMLNYYGAHCVPGDTEVLTLMGWERLDTWDGGAVAQWSPDGNIEFRNATRYIGPAINKWVVSTAPYMPVDMTLGHTVPVLAHGSRKLQPMAAGDMVGRGASYIPTSGHLQNRHRFTPEQTRVLVMIQADGSYEGDTAKGRKLSIFLKKPRKIQRARELLTAAKVAFEEQTYPSWPGYIRFIVRHRYYAKWMLPQLKLFGPWVMRCPLDIFMDELKYWDGWTQGGQVCYSTSERSNAEWVQTAAHLAGLGCAISERPGKGNRRTNYNLRFRNRAECMVKRQHLAVVDKEQQAYCVRSETGYWLARANNTIFVTGNTGRFSGGDRVNLQNLPRGGALRRALSAPKGKVLIACDSSQIEARIVAWVSGQHDLVQQFADKRDVYSEFASEVYGRPITKNDKLERHVGKTAVLGLGYGMGAEKFRRTLEIGAGGIKVVLTEDEATRIVRLYREKNYKIAQFWQRCSHALGHMLQGTQFGLSDALPSLVTGHEMIHLPNKLAIRYPLLHSLSDGYCYAGANRVYRDAIKARVTGAPIPYDKFTRIYGGKCTENIVQALARIVVSEQMVAIGVRHKVVLQVHDEVVIMCDESEAPDARAFMEQAMSTPPKWAADLPVACESGVGPNYGECK